MITTTENKNNFIVTILLMMLLFPFIQQRTYEEVPELIQNFYKYMPIVSATFMYIKVFIDRKLYLNNYLKLFLIFWIYLILTTAFINNMSGIWFLCQNAYCFIGMTLFLNNELNKRPKVVINSLSIIYHAFILLNFILFVIFPKGIYETHTYHTGHLLGDDNALIYLILPGLVINFINSYIKRKKISKLCIFELLSTIFMFISVWSVTSVICIIIFTILLLVSRFIKNFRASLLIYILIGIIVLLLFGLDLPIVQDFIQNTLHKTVTLSGRTYLWKMSLNLIKRSFLFGYGGYFNHGHFFMNGMYYPCHTPYLQILIDGGIFALLIFGIMIYRIYSSARKYKSNRIVNILIIGLTVMLINYIFEYSQFYHLYIILIIIVNCNMIVENKEVISNE